MKAVGLLSGGLDSTLAARLIIEQGFEVHAINFTSPFCQCTPKNSCCASVVDAVRQLGNIPLKRIGLGQEYLDMLARPKHGYGRGMNPCLDCRIMKIQKAGEYMREIGASFLFTGEVLGQRPMSQHKRALALIDRDSGLGDVTVRPLSAHHFQPTLPEREGLLNRVNLLSIQGRSRKEQIELAREKNITDYPCPAGGCLLTDGHFAERMRDYLKHVPQPRLEDMAVLKIGRHFRQPDGDKIIVARDEQECNRLAELAKPDEYLLIPESFTGPHALLQGSDLDGAIKKILLFSRKPPVQNVRFLCRHKNNSWIIEKVLQSSAL